MEPSYDNTIATPLNMEGLEAACKRMIEEAGKPPSPEKMAEMKQEREAERVFGEELSELMKSGEISENDALLRGLWFARVKSESNAGMALYMWRKSQGTL